MSAYSEIRYQTPANAANYENYWQYYGLRWDPFAPDTTETGTFLLPRWEQYFDLLQHLCTTSNVLITIIGALGSGKSTFLELFLNGARNETFRVARLYGSPILSVAKLCITLVKEFSQPPLTGENLEEQLDILVSNLQHSPQTCLLIVDDAHRLPAETLQALIYLIKQQSESQMRLHIILLGEIALQNSISTILAKENEKEIVHHIPFNSFTLDETEDYIQYRLKASGLPAAIPLTQTAIERVHTFSGGLPGKINRVARQALINGMQTRKTSFFADYIRPYQTKFMGGSILLIALILVTYFMVHNIHRPANNWGYNTTQLRTSKAHIATANVPPQIAVTANTQPNLVQESRDVMPASAQPSLVQQPTQDVMPAKAGIQVATATPAPVVTPAPIPAQPQTAPVVATVAAAPAPVIPVTTPAVAPVQQQSTVTEAAPAQPTSTPVVVAPVVAESAATPSTPQPVTTTAPVAVNNSVAAAPTVTAAADESPVAAVPVAAAPATPSTPASVAPAIAASASHTIQILALSSEQALHKFAASNNLNQDANYFHITRAGKDFYVLTIGQYNSYSEATAALQQLPKKLQDLHPWVRSIATLKSAAPNA